MNLNSVMIGSENPERLVEYYTRLFGEPVWVNGGYTGWKLGEGFLVVGAHDQVKGKNASPGRLLLNIESEDVQGDFERLKAAGAIVVAEPYTMTDEAGTGTISTLADPDDNYFQLVTAM